MRIISSDRRYDFQYEQIIIEVDDNCIFAHPAFDVSKNYLIARYSTKEKVEKAMLLLHKIYVKAPLENEAKEMGEFVRGTFKAIGTSGYVEPESNYFVFRFPREDEI